MGSEESSGSTPLPVPIPGENEAPESGLVESESDSWRGM